MIGFRLIHPRTSLLRPSSQFRQCYKQLLFPQLKQTASFTTSPCIFKQAKIPSNDGTANKVVDLRKTASEPPSSISNEIYTVPNMLTISRIAATPFIGYFLATAQTVPAIALFTYSCVTDFVDGYIARRFNMKSVLGSILDPAADKFLMTTCTVAMAIPGSMPLYVASAIIGRDVILSFIGFYVRFVSLPPPVTLRRYLDMSITTHTVHPNLLGKVNTALQMFYIGGLVIKPAIESFWLLDLSGSFDYFGMFVAVSTICSGLSYVVGKNSFKAILSTGSK